MHCVDLKTRRTIWYKELPQDGPPLNYKYYNRVNISVRNGALFIFSAQSWGPGQFAWKLSPETGEPLN